MTVKVKSLVWVADNDDPDCLRSGEYWIYHEGLGYQVYLGAVVFGDPHKTLAAAQDAVWQHHVASILAAIEAPDHLALVAAAYRDAEDQCRKEERRREHQCTQVRSGKVNVHIDQLRRWEGGKVQADMLAETVHARTPADAEAHLTALLRAEYERGVRAMADMAIGALAVPQIGTVSEIVRDVQRALLTQEGR